MEPREPLRRLQRIVWLVAFAVPAYFIVRFLDDRMGWQATTGAVAGILVIAGTAYELYRFYKAVTKRLKAAWTFIVDEWTVEAEVVARRPVRSAATRAVAIGTMTAIAAALGTSLSWILPIGGGFAVAYLWSYSVGKRRGERAEAPE